MLLAQYCEVSFDRRERVKVVLHYHLQGDGEQHGLTVQVDMGEIFPDLRMQVEEGHVKTITEPLPAFQNLLQAFLEVHGNPLLTRKASSRRILLAGPAARSGKSQEVSVPAAPPNG